MLVTLQKDYIPLPYEEGTVENINRTATAELSDSAGTGGGIHLRPGEKFVFNSQLYARSNYPGMKLALVASAGGSGGGVDPEDIATDDEVEDLIDDVYGNDTSEAGAGEDTVSGDGADLDGL